MKKRTLILAALLSLSLLLSSCGEEPVEEEETHPGHDLHPRKL